MYDGWKNGMLTVNAKLEMVLAFFDKRSDMVERRASRARAEGIFLNPKLVNIIIILNFNS